MHSRYGVIRSLHMYGHYRDSNILIILRYDFFKFKIVRKLTNGDIAKGPWDTKIEPSLIFMFKSIFCLLFKLFLVCVAHGEQKHAGAKKRGHVHLGGGVTD